MKTLCPLGLIAGVLFGCAEFCMLDAQTSNHPPLVCIEWPADDCQASYIFGPFTHIKIKTIASDPDGTIAQVKFFADMNQIALVTNAPYNVVWQAAPSGSIRLTAVAEDNLGATTESDSVLIGVLAGFPTSPIFAISSPPNGGLFAAPASFDYSAELLASPYGQTGSVEFFVGTNSVGTRMQTGEFTAATPPYSLTVSNIAEGEYLLRVEKDGYYARLASCRLPHIRVTKLAMNTPRLTAENRFAFDVVTSFPTNQNVIETSSNLLNWTPISTSVPFTNTFPFTAPSPATGSAHFFRAVVPLP